MRYLIIIPCALVIAIVVVAGIVDIGSDLGQWGVPVVGSSVSIAVMTVFYYGEKAKQESFEAGQASRAKTRKP